MNADKLLKEVQITYWRSGRVWRDALLDCGAKLHNYILAYVKEGEGLSEDRRFQNRLTREQAVKNAAAALQIKRRNVLEMVQGIAVVRLLADDGQVGTLVWKSILEFATLLCRRTGSFNDHAARVVAGRNGESVTAIEEWEVRSKHDGAAQALFRQVVATDHLTREQIHAMILQLRTGGTQRPYYNPTVGQMVSDDEEEGTPETFERQQAAARLASPGDVADMCLALIEKARDPVAVALRLRVMLQKYLPQKQRA